MKIDSTALIILSCDKYSDIWPIYFDCFFKNWPDCPFPIYLTTNLKKYDDQRVISLTSDFDKDWSSCIKSSLGKIKTDRYFFLIDDAFLISPVNTKKIIEIHDWFIKNDASFLRILPLPQAEHKEIIEKIREDHFNRVGLMSSIWKKNIFLDLLKDGESAQQFEIIGSSRAAKLPSFYCMPEQQIRFLHGIKKGKWYRSAVRELKKMGYRADLSARPQLPRFQHLRHIIFKIEARIKRYLKVTPYPR